MVVGFGAIAFFFWTDDQRLRSIALTVLVAALVLRLGEMLLRALRPRRIAGVDRANRPGAYRALTAGLLILLLLIVAAQLLALRV